MPRRGGEGYTSRTMPPEDTDRNSGGVLLSEARAGCVLSMPRTDFAMVPMPIARGAPYKGGTIAPEASDPCQTEYVETGHQ